MIIKKTALRFKQMDNEFEVKIEDGFIVIYDVDEDCNLFTIDAEEAHELIAVLEEKANQIPLNGKSSAPCEKS